jgi:hypothetical protein
VQVHQDGSRQGFWSSRFTGECKQASNGAVAEINYCVQPTSDNTGDIWGVMRTLVPLDNRAYGDPVITANAGQQYTISIPRIDTRTNTTRNTRICSLGWDSQKPDTLRCY